MEGRIGEQGLMLAGSAHAAQYELEQHRERERTDGVVRRAVAQIFGMSRDIELEVGLNMFALASIRGA